MALPRFEYGNTLPPFLENYILYPNIYIVNNTSYTELGACKLSQQKKFKIL
jgi:hypothetical protein